MITPLACIDLPQTRPSKKALAEVPKGLKTAIKIEVATRLDNGTFDSIQKVRAVDEICGTELEKMI